MRLGVILPFMTTHTLLPPGPTPSCRVDSLTCSYKLRSADACDELINLGWNVGYFVMPTGVMQPPRGARLFEKAFHHDSGVYIELTPPSSSRKNAGSGILTVPGAVLAALDARERLDLYLELYSFEGFYRCTRIDTQLTVLDPVVTIYEFLDEVSAGNIWAKGFSSGQPYARYDRSGKHLIAPTWYFGAPDSPTRVRIYDHGVKHQWSVPTMRIETQQRKRNADDTFRSLVKSAIKEVDNEPLLLVGEANLVKAVSREKADLRDTTGIDREKMGSKWLRKAPRLSWYAELVDAPGAPVERRARPVPTLGQSVSAGVAQYGGKNAAWFLRGMAVEGATQDQVGAAYVERCAAVMTEEHRAMAKEGLTAEQQARVDELYAHFTHHGPLIAEHLWCD